MTAGHIFSANTLPETKDNSPAFWNRWVLAEWVLNHKRDEDIKDLAALVFEKEKEAIVAWALEGAQRLHQNGSYSLGQTHETVRDRWSKERNSALAWIEARTGMGGELTKPMRLGVAYYDFERWCQKTGRTKISYNAFVKEICTHLGVDQPSALGGYKVVRGLDIIGDAPF